MSAVQDALYTSALFGLFMIVIPVVIFTIDLLKNYYKKEKKDNEMARRSRRDS